MKFAFVLLTALAFLPFCPLQAQENLQLSPNPQKHEVAEAFAKEDAVMILDKRIHEYVPQKEELAITVSHLRIIKVQSAAGVEMYNKMYVPVPYDGKIDKIEARVITPGGKVMPLPQDKILDVEEEGTPYKKFALEGVEIGAEIEILTKVTRGLGFFGLEVFQSNRTPIQQAAFTLVVPEHLYFDAKGYNGIVMSADTVIGKKRIKSGGGKNLPVLEGEKYAEAAPFVACVQYKLSYNKSNNENLRIFTWNQLAQNVYQRNTTFSEKEMKALAGFLKNMKPAGTSVEDKITAAENYIKSNININEEALSDEADKLDNVVKYKVADHSGIVRLFAAAFTQLEVPFQFVFPNKRDEIPKDEKLENYRLVDDPVFYFPDTRKYLEPVNLGYRYPYIEPYNAGTRGLFVRSTALGGTVSVFAAFDTIPIPGWKETMHNLEAKVQLDAGLDSVMVHAKHIFSGFTGSIYRSVFNYIQQSKQSEVVDEILKSAAPDARIKDFKVHQTSFAEGLQNKPLLVEGNIVSAALAERAGKRILLKIGQIIGPQVEMYQEKERKLPMMIEYPHVLDRVIEVSIPDGYKVKNLQDLNIKHLGTESGADDMGFISTYTLEGNKLVITIQEYYKAIHYPIARIENFRQVINAAADFNKVVLVLEKQ